MRPLFDLTAALLLSAVLLIAAPSIDKVKLESYIRYAEGFSDDVHFTIDDPVPASPNFYKIAVHLSKENGAKLEQVYYLTQDGKQIVNGSVWDLSKSPFAEKLSQMPDSGYAFGPLDAKVKLVVFSDFECPYCREFAKTIRDNIPKKYPKDVRVVFEDFPLEQIHPWARAAAEASHCIGDQKADAFWDFHDWIFAHSAEIKPDSFKPKVLTWAADQKLDSAKLQSCMETHADAAIVRQSEDRGKVLMVRQTPTAFANGREVPGALPWKDLEPIIQIELKRAGETTTPAATR